MIHLSNGYQFEYVAASGALAYDGRGWPWEWPLRWTGLLDPRLFTIVTKTLTPEPCDGNLRWSHPWSVVANIPNGVVNAIGLSNPGLDWWLKDVAPGISKSGYNIVCSITGDNPTTVATMAQKLDKVPIRAIELNASCPNTDQKLVRPLPSFIPRNQNKTGSEGAEFSRDKELLQNAALVVEMVQAIREVTQHPIILKLSVVHDYIHVAKSCEGLVEALAINSVPWSVAFPDQKSPLAHFGGGGISGRAAQLWTWGMVEELALGTSIPVIGPGVWEFFDLAHLRELGARAISFGSIFMRYPWRPTEFVRRDMSLTNI